MLKFFLKFIRNLRKYLVLFWEQEGLPGERARGFAVGVFSGCFPLFGLQIGLGLLLAAVFKGNRVMAAIGTLISNPITYIPLYWFNYRIGSIIIGNSQVDLFHIQTTVLELWSRGWLFTSRLLLGSAVTGVLAGSCAGFIVYIIFRHRSSTRFR